MGEFTFVGVGLIVFCLLASLVYARKKTSTTQLFDPQPVDYVITIWAEKSAESGPTNLANQLQPHKITAAYHVRLQANSAQELSNVQGQFVQQANADFKRRFIPMLDHFNIGAVLCEPALEKEQSPLM